jgi:hypothetical protein
VFQTISRVVASGRAIVMTGAQVSDGVVRQQFFASADGGATWQLAPVHAAGGGQPSLGYQATRLAAGPRGWVAVGTTGPEATWTSRDGLSWTLAATHGISPQQPGDQVFVLYHHRRPRLVPGPDPAVTALTADASGFTAAVQTGTPGRQDVTIWTSQDGAGWTPAPAGALSSAVPGNLCLGRLLYRSRLSSSASVVAGLRRSHYRGHLPPL